MFLKRLVVTQWENYRFNLSRIPKASALHINHLCRNVGISFVLQTPLASQLDLPSNLGLGFGFGYGFGSNFGFDFGFGLGSGSGLGLGRRFSLGFGPATWLVAAEALLLVCTRLLRAHHPGNFTGSGLDQRRG